MCRSYLFQAEFFLCFSKKLTLMLRGEKYGLQGTLKWEAAIVATREMRDASGAVGWGGRAVCPGKGPGKAGCFVGGREGGVGADAQGSSLGNRLLVIPFG